MKGIRWAFSLEFEDDQTVVMSSRKEVELRMRCKDPEAVMLSPERLHRRVRRVLRQVPNANRLVVNARHDQLVLGVEKRS